MNFLMIFLMNFLMKVIKKVIKKFMRSCLKKSSVYYLKIDRKITDFRVKIGNFEQK